MIIFSDTFVAILHLPADLYRRNASISKPVSAKKRTKPEFISCHYLKKKLKKILQFSFFFLLFSAFFSLSIFRFPPQNKQGNCLKVITFYPTILTFIYLFVCLFFFFTIVSLCHSSGFSSQMSISHNCKLIYCSSDVRNSFLRIAKY